MPENADQLFATAKTKKIRNLKLKSTLLTTHGGVKRDMGQREAALNFGAQAHEATPDNFRPCPLLGAVHIEMGHFTEAHEWYQKR